MEKECGNRMICMGPKLPLTNSSVGLWGKVRPGLAKGISLATASYQVEIPHRLILRRLWTHGGWSTAAAFLLDGQGIGSQAENKPNLDTPRPRVLLCPPKHFTEASSSTFSYLLSRHHLISAYRKDADVLRNEVTWNHTGTMGQERGVCVRTRQSRPS